MGVALGVVVGFGVAASIFAAARLLSGPRRVISPERQAMQAALHAAMGTLPHLRKGLSPQSAQTAAPHLRALTQAPAIALLDASGQLLAFEGDGSDHHRRGAILPLELERDERVQVQTRFRCQKPGCPLRAAIVAPLLVQGDRLGTLVALYRDGGRLRPEDTRGVEETAALISAQIALATLAEQEERIAEAELRALRAQISPHFVYNALAAVASEIHTNPEQARELLTEFAEFIRYAFRRDRPYVTLAEELRYVEKYLRLERARFGERLEVRLEVAPEVLQAVLPVLSLQPLVENAVRHGVERSLGVRHVEIVAIDLGRDAEVRVSDDGTGMDEARAQAALNGAGEGIGLSNVQSRLRWAFGEGYGLELESETGEGTTVVMTIPKFRAGVRAA
ncbi:MAG TPA: histidine kinase [Thermoleophilaceae bacterium]|nr:histidine kinase [Thermoleophilaceae bacterium]